VGPLTHGAPWPRIGCGAIVLRRSTYPTSYLPRGACSCWSAVLRAGPASLVNASHRHCINLRLVEVMLALFEQSCVNSSSRPSLHCPLLLMDGLLANTLTVPVSCGFRAIAALLFLPQAPDSGENWRA